jgi:hypothetical protein
MGCRRRTNLVVVRKAGLWFIGIIASFQLKEMAGYSVISAFKVNANPGYERKHVYINFVRLLRGENLPLRKILLFLPIREDQITIFVKQKKFCNL